MIKTFPIEFVRQILEQTLLYEHNYNLNYFGGQDQIAIHSFYEQLKDKEQVDRFVETYQDLADQQNRTGLIGNAILTSPENPTITNLYSDFIVPLQWACSMRVKLSDRDQMVETLYNLIDKLKGRKFDVAQLECKDFMGKTIYKPYVVGVLGQDEGIPSAKSGDFLGIKAQGTSINTFGNDKLYDLTTNYGFSTIITGKYWFTYEQQGIIKVCQMKVKNFSYIWQVLDDTTPDHYEVIDGEFQEEPLDVSYFGDNQFQISGIWNSRDDLPNFDMNATYYMRGTITLKDGDGHTKTIEINEQPNIYKEEGSDLVYAQIIYDFVDDTLVGSTTTIDDYTLDLYKELDVDDVPDITKVIFPDEHTSFEKYKVSISCDTIRCDEPRTLNEQEYCEISFGGNATIVDEKVALGNDLLKIGIKKDKIIASPSNISLSSSIEYVEPMEMPSGNSASTQLNQLASNFFKQNTHTDGNAINLQYSFIVDRSINIINQMFLYARYGNMSATSSGISPNMIFTISELWCSWGDVERYQYSGKIVDSIDVDNTESDVLSLSVKFQLQGSNN